MRRAPRRRPGVPPHEFGLLVLLGLLLLGGGTGCRSAPPLSTKSTHTAPAGDPAAAILDDDRYRFCHDEQYLLYAHEAPWCALITAPDPRCPALPAICRQAAAGHLAESEEAEGAERALRTGEAARKWWDVLGLPALVGFGRVLFWGLIIAGVAVVLHAVVRHLRSRNKDDQAAALAPTVAPESADPQAAARRLVETDVDRLLARAQDAAARGDYRAGMADAYAALLRHLEGEGLIRVHPSRTNGDYLRDLRDQAPRGPSLQPPVRSVIREVERVQFGSEEPSLVNFRSVFEQVVPLVGRSLPTLMTLALALLLALGGVTACRRGGFWRGTDRDSPSGTGAVLDLLHKSGLDARERLQALDKVGDETGALVLLPGTPVDDPTWKHLDAWVERGGRLVVTGAPPALAKTLEVRWANAVASVPPRLTGAAALAQRWGGLRLAAPGTAYLEPKAVKGESVEVLITRAGSPYALRAIRGKGEIWYFADAHLFSNIALVVEDNAQFLTGLLSTQRFRVELTDVLTGAAARTPAESIRRGRLAPLLLQLGVLLVLFFVHRGAAFGLLRDPPARSRRRFIEHVQALGQQYARARAARHVAALYAGYTLDRLRERIPLGGRGGTIALSEAVATRLDRPLREIAWLLGEAHALREDPHKLHRSESDDLYLVRELARLLHQLGGTR
ncbi:MAG TPA: DUF4350 domain-containing protein [Polyangia bacterium]|jgi:hypothetical protein|nr:DUF4350 domain-containing protein [Polyangia bacterium]